MPQHKYGVQVRLKNKGARKRSGRKRPKYQAPVAEHPETDSKMVSSQLCPGSFGVEPTK